MYIVSYYRFRKIFIVTSLAETTVALLASRPRRVLSVMLTGIVVERRREERRVEGPEREGETRERVVRARRLARQVQYRTRTLGARRRRPVHYCLFIYMEISIELLL